MDRFVLIAIGLVVALGAVIAVFYYELARQPEPPHSGPVTSKSPPTQAPEPEELRALLIQRKDVLQQILVTVRRQYDAGVSTPTEVRRATMALLEADLDLCKTDGDRIRVHEKLVELMRSEENQIEARVNVGSATSSELAKARAARLDAEIRLLRERVKADKEPR